MGGAWWKSSWVRDYLIPITCIIVALLIGIPFGWWVPIFLLLSVAALSTYWDWFFGYDNYYCHGFFVGLASAPLAYITDDWWMFVLRTIILTLWMGIWSAVVDDDDLEEFGRYSIVGLTITMIC